MSDKTLRSKLIRLAYERPELRPEILPLVTKKAGHPDEALEKAKVAIQMEISEALEYMKAVLDSGAGKSHRGYQSFQKMLGHLDKALIEIKNAERARGW